MKHWTTSINEDNDTIESIYEETMFNVEFQENIRTLTNVYTVLADVQDKTYAITYPHLIVIIVYR